MGTNDANTPTLRQMVINFWYNLNLETLIPSTKLGYQILGEKTKRELVKGLTGLKSKLDSGEVKPGQFIPIWVQVDYMNEATEAEFEAKTLPDGSVLEASIGSGEAHIPFD